MVIVVIVVVIVDHSPHGGRFKLPYGEGCPALPRRHMCLVEDLERSDASGVSQPGGQRLCVGEPLRGWAARPTDVRSRCLPCRRPSGPERDQRGSRAVLSELLRPLRVVFSPHSDPTATHDNKQSRVKFLKSAVAQRSKKETPSKGAGFT